MPATDAPTTALLDHLAERVVTAAANSTQEAQTDPHSAEFPRDFFDIIDIAADDVAEREFLFGVQQMFGCKVRAVTRDGHRRYLIAGHAFQRSAMWGVMEACHRLVSDSLDTLDDTGRRQFWATLAARAVSTATGRDLSRHNATVYRYAAESMNDTHGPARTLPRITIED